MGKEKAGFLTPKAISNRIKAKGLQKLKWYCQMCQKQCRDENGFKCHQTSESHQRQLLLFAEKPEEFLDTFSREFEDDFLETLRRRFGTKRVKANNVYQEYISDRHHVHMNSTQWETLTEFVKYLGRTAKCVVDDTERGWFIQYIDRDPEAIKRQESIQRKERLDKDDEEKMMEFLERQIEKASNASSSGGNAGNEESASGCGVETSRSALSQYTELKRENEEERIVLPELGKATFSQEQKGGAGEKKESQKTGALLPENALRKAALAKQAVEEKLAERKKEKGALPPAALGKRGSSALEDLMRDWERERGRKEGDWKRARSSEERLDRMVAERRFKEGRERDRERERDRDRERQRDYERIRDRDRERDRERDRDRDRERVRDREREKERSKISAQKETDLTPAVRLPVADTSPWLCEGIVVKMISAALGDRYHRKKGVIVKLEEPEAGARQGQSALSAPPGQLKTGRTAVLKMLDSGDKLRVDEKHVESVIPALGRPVRVLRGQYRGATAELVSLDEPHYCCAIKVPGHVVGRNRAVKVEGLPYEAVCKLHVTR